MERVTELGFVDFDINAKLGRTSLKNRLGGVGAGRPNFSGLSKVQSLAMHARASAGQRRCRRNGVYTQLYYVRDGEHAFLTISSRTQKYEVFQMYEKSNVCIFHSIFEVLYLYSLIY